jgi:hypothetical protein
VCCYYTCHDNALKGLRALCDNFYDVCVFLTVAMVMLLRDFGPNRIILITVFSLYFPVNLDAKFTTIP